MAGLTAGYFPSTYFPHEYWQLANQYWAEYGAVTGGDSSKYYYRQAPVKKDRKPLLNHIKNLLEALKGE